MYIVCITATIGFILAIILTVNSIREDMGYFYGVIDWFGEIFVGLLQVIFGVMVGGVLGLLLALPFPMKTHLEKRQILIENLQDGNSIHGSFFLGIGSVDGNMKYTYYTKQGDLYELNQMDARKVKVRYTDGTPRITFSKRVLDKDEWINKWSFDSNLGDCGDYVIEVPKGSIKSEFNLDAQ